MEVNEDDVLPSGADGAGVGGLGRGGAVSRGGLGWRIEKWIFFLLGLITRGSGSATGKAARWNRDAIPKSSAPVANP